MRSVQGIGGGPANFFVRLTQEINRTKSARIVGSYNLFQDIGLYGSVRRGLPWGPYIIRLDGIYFDKAETYGSNKELNEGIFRSISGASGIIFQSLYSHKLVESHYGKIDVPNVVILNGAQVQQRQIATRKKAGLEQGRIRTIICAAKWRKHKRLEAIIQVVRELNKNGDYELVILGAVDEGRVSDPFVKYIGHVDKDSISQYLDSADLFLHLCWLDSCPNAVVEAITHGLPIVCSNQGGTPEIVRATNAGCVSECDAPVDYAGLVDLYKPPMPDINTVASSVRYVFDNYSDILNKIDFTQVDITLTAQEYTAFCKQIFDSK